MNTTVDGRNPAPVDRYIVFPLFTRFYTSLVVQDFLHQQYHLKGGFSFVTGISQKLIGGKLPEKYLSIATQKDLKTCRG